MLHRRGLCWLLAAGLFLALPASAAAQTGKRHVHVIATGGTIAETAGGLAKYAPGQVDIGDLLKAVPGLSDLAQVSAEQFINIGSQDMTDAIWLQLAARVNAVLRQPEVDGVVVTHGTDTLEETAYFLNLVVRSDKPVVLTGAMRPANALGADGPLNLFEAVAVAAEPRARGQGVLVALNDEIHYARAVTKQNNMKLEAFASPNRGPAGLVMGGRAFLYGAAGGRHTVASEFDVAGVAALPRVEILYAYANMGRAFIDYAVESGVKGLVIAGLGNGDLPEVVRAGVGDAVKRGVAVVRASRSQSGAVARNVEVNDDALGSVASMELNPQKARVLLMLGLLQSNNPARLQALFYQY